MNNQIKKEIFNAIRGQMSITELSRLTGRPRPTVAKAVDILEAENKIKIDESRPPYRLVQRIEIKR